MSRRRQTIARVRRSTAGLIAVSVAISLLGVAGCQEQVVGVKNNWAGANDAPRPDYAPPPPKKDTLETVGDALFGWTKVFESDESKPQDYREARQQYLDADTRRRLNESSSEPTERSSGTVR